MTLMDSPADAVLAPRQGSAELPAPSNAPGYLVGVALAAAGGVLVVRAFTAGEASGLGQVILGLVLILGALARQALRIRDLERRVIHREQQLGVVGNVVSVLSGSPDVGHTLEAALWQIRTGMEADAAVAWLPVAAGDTTLRRAMESGLDSQEDCGLLLDAVREEMVFADAGPRSHRFRGGDGGDAHCLSVRVGRRDDALGFLSVLRCDRPFDDQDGVVLSAVGNDLAATLHHARLVSDAERRADRDPVTGLFNHRYAFERLYREVERLGKTRTPVSVLMLDLDNFKLFNDTYGHPAGDAMLRKTAGVLRRCFRDSDIVARYGGDEFLVILPGASLEQAVAGARRVQERFANEHFSEGAAAQVPVYVSCGVANCPGDATEVLELVSVADANLYAAKSQGRGNITARTLDVMDDRLLAVEGFDLLRSLVIAVDNKDRYTRRHSEEVTAYALQIADELELDEEMRRSIHLCGLLHDLGKIGIPDRILRKPGRLTPEETDVMNQHPVIGALIVGSLPGREEVVQGVRHHHERYDGTGYPDGLAGESIPLIARLLSVADVYSAMTTHRPYRKALTRAQALAEIERNRGTQFDPEIAGIFLRLMATPSES